MNNLWLRFLNLFRKHKGLSSIGFGDIVGKGIVAGFWFLIASLLETEEFGEINYFIAIAGVGFTIVLFATQHTITVFSAKNIKLESTLFLISLISGGIASIVIFGIFYKIDVSLLLFGYIMNEMAIGYLLGKKFYNKYTKYLLTQKILTIVLGLSFFFLIGVEGILLGIALSYLHFVIIVWKVFQETKINFSILKSKLEFIINNYLYSVTGGFRGNIDKLLIAPLLGLSLLGNYAIAIQFESVLMIFSSIAFKYFLSQDASGIKNRNLKKWVIISSIVISIAGLIFLPYVIQWLFPKYVEAVDAIKIISLSIFPATLALIYTSKFLANEKSRVVLASTVLNIIVEIIGMITLGPIFGLVGVAFAYLMGIISNAVFLMVSDKLIKNDDE